MDKLLAKTKNLMSHLPRSMPVSNSTFREQIDYKGVARWTKGDVFTKDFLLFPICENDHWSIAIICYPQRVIKLMQDHIDWCL